MKTSFFTILFLLVRKHLLWLIAIACIFYCLSCNKNGYIDEHPDFINAVYKRMDTVQAKYVDNAFIFIDSFYNTLSEPGTGDLFVKDSIKQNHYGGLLKHDYVKSMSLLDTMMGLIKDKVDEEKYAERYAVVLYLKSDCFRKMKQYNDALYYISLAEKAVSSFVKDKCSMVYYNSFKAYLLFEQEKYLASAAAFLDHYKKFLSSCSPDKYNRSFHADVTLNNVALSYLRAGVPDSASWYQQAALHAINTNESAYESDQKIKYAKGVIFGDQAEVLALEGKYVEAEMLYNESITGTSTEDIGYTQITQARLADAYLKDYKNKEAYEVLAQLKHSLDRYPNEKQSIALNRLSASYYAQKNNFDSARKYQLQYNALRDSVEARDKNFISADIMKEFENLELRYSNDILQKEDKLKTIYLGIALVIFVTITAIAIFVWYNLKHTQKLHQQVNRQNEEIQIAFTSLELSHQENNRIIRIVAHDLKNPVSTINNLVFSMLRKNLSADLKEIFLLIKTASSNSMVLINDALLQKKNAAVIRKELVDMKSLLEYCVGLLQAKANEKNQHLTLQAEDVSAMLNRQKMWQVISNIVTNAIKFSPEHAAIDIKLQRRDSSILLSVQDKGIGIPENLKDKIFAMSPEASRPGTFGEKSYGLGLSISQKIIEEHQGKMWFESIDGKGSIFYLELPCPN